jgi:hypothetical protein
LIFCFNKNYIFIKIFIHPSTQQMKKIFLLLFAIMLVQGIQAQPIFNFGPEIGITVSRFPEKDNYTTSTDDVQSKTMPLFGPLAGIQTQLIVRKLFLFTSGLEFEIAGTRHTFHNDGTDPNNFNLAFTADITENQTFHKIGLPLSAGITFPLFKVHISMYGGWRGNYFLKANYYKKTVVAYPTKPDFDYTTVTDVNPLKEEECPVNINPLNNQVYFGLSVSKGRFEYVLNYCSGLEMSYSKDPNTGSVEYKNTGYSFSIKYRFYGLRKQNQECNLFD